ncbi:MAG: hypothetical protein KJ896_05675 [Nanoarchaeota archaeon]|nr:hypothetical protein [Nanoarchaeota archaeon]
MWREFGHFGFAIEVACMKNQDMQESFVEKLKSLRNGLKEAFPTIDVHNLLKIMNKLAHYHYNKSKFYMIGVEKEVYNFLIENGYNPYTVYRWLLLEKVPEDIRFRLKQNELTQKEAMAKACSRRKETDESLGLQ